MKSKKTKLKPVRCHCGSIAVIRDGSFVHGEKSWDRKLYVCSRFPECDSYVGVDERTQLPLGTLAGGNLRHKRIEAHKLFDALWKHGVMTRSNAYRWMGDKFGLRSRQAHIGYFSEYMCDELMAKCRKALRNNKIAC